MRNTKPISNFNNSRWLFIEENLPSYSSRDDVLYYDILFRYIDGDDVCEEDVEWIENDFKCDKEMIRKELVRLETKFVSEINYKESNKILGINGGKLQDF